MYCASFCLTYLFLYYFLDLIKGGKSETRFWSEYFFFTIFIYLKRTNSRLIRFPQFYKKKSGPFVSPYLLYNLIFAGICPDKDSDSLPNPFFTNQLQFQYYHHNHCCHNYNHPYHTRQLYVHFTQIDR